MEERITLIDPNQGLFSSQEKVYRQGIELEKGIILTEQFLEENEELFADVVQMMTAYPDLYLDMITPENSSFTLFPYQRVFLRACMRYNTLYITAARATSKTFLSILAKYLQCMALPNHVGSIVAPNKNQAAKIARQKIEEIWRIFPLLKLEIEKSNFGKDYVDITFKNGARLSIVGAIDSDRGIRTHATLLDEVRDQDGKMISEVVLPQMNVSRRTINGTLNPYEVINTQVIYATSAGTKASFAYEALIDTFEQSIFDPKRSFCIGLDYRIPAMHGLIDANFVKGLRLSPSYDENTFAAEYLGTWLGGSEESWFTFSKLSKYRKIKNPELHAKYRASSNVFYLISVDVGRLSDQTVACVFRVNIKDMKYISTLVYITVLGKKAESKVFSQQAIDLKTLMAAYKPKEVVIDCNGLGVGLADEMIREQYDRDGNLMPAYGFFNNDDYKKVQPKSAEKILYSMKATAQINSKMHGAVYARLGSGMIRFLITEQEAKTAMLATKRGQKMSIEKRIERVMPHELTTRLFDEMANLRLKRNGLDIALERINARYPKDKYSAFGYGIWRIKELEEANYTKQMRRNRGKKRKLVFFSGGM